MTDDPVIRDRALRVCIALHPAEPIQPEPCDVCLQAARLQIALAERRQIEAAAAGPG